MIFSLSLAPLMAIQSSWLFFLTGYFMTILKTCVLLVRKNEMSVHYFCVLFCSNIIQQGRGDQGLFGFLPEDIWQQASYFSRVTLKKSLRCFWAARSLHTKSCFFSLSTCYDERNFNDLSRNQSQSYRGENLCPQARVAEECQNGAIFSNNVGIDEQPLLNV